MLEKNMPVNSLANGNQPGLLRRTASFSHIDKIVEVSNDLEEDKEEPQ